MRLLIIEDDDAIRGLVHRQLESRGIGVTVARDASSGLAALQRTPFDIVLLDLTLPDVPGLEVLRTLRALGSAAHVIILSGLSAEDDRVRAFELGADDYVVKPFFARELTARVLAVRRRREANEDMMLRFDRLTIDLIARQVTVDGSPTELTAMEFDLLAFLAARPGHVFSREELLRSVWASSDDKAPTATITEHVRRLRGKIERDPQHPEWLVTLRGFGYRFDPVVDQGETMVGVPERQCDAYRSGSLVHVEGRIVSVDDAVLELIGLTHEAELLGRNLLELVAPASRSAARARLAVTASGPAPRSQVIELQRADGGSLLAEVSSSMTEWEGQPARHVVLTASADPSSRLRQFVTGVFSELSDAVIVTDLHAHVRSWNAAAERLYGWAEHEVLGRHILDIVPWTRDDAALASTWLSLEEEGRWHGEGRQVTRDGSSVTVRASTTLVRDERKEPIGIVAVNRPVITRPALAPGLDHLMCDEAEIRAGLDRDEFEVHYQPVVALDGCQVVAVEGLVRWRHPKRGLLAPDAFIHAAESTGLVRRLGSAVLEKACRQAARWRADGADVELAVNLSTKELADPELADRIIATLDASGLDPNRLWLEVTETTLVEDVDQAVELLHRLAAAGIRIAIDDFGTGWASLTYLKLFPVHALKIDRSFVSGIDHNPSDLAIARSIILLGRELGLAVIAEGIETAAQEHMLRELGCSMGQGYLYGRPRPADAVPIPRLAISSASPAV
jgi:PAS domain S-box-containing protein